MLQSPAEAESIVCPFCLSEVPAAAQKCRYCCEWLKLKTSGELLAGSGEGRASTTKNPPMPAVSFQRRLAERFAKINPWLFYLFVSILSYSAIAIYWSFSNEDRVYLVSFFLQAIQMFCCSAGIVWFEKLLDRFRVEIPAITGWTDEKSDEYFIAAKQRICSSGYPTFIALIVCSVAVFGDNFIVSLPFATTGGKIAYSLYEFFYLFWTAAALVMFLRFALFIREFGSHELHILLIQEENTGIRLLGKILLQTALFAVIPYIMGLTARQLGDWNFNGYLIAWFACFGLAILIYLFWPIYNIHSAMAREKDQKLRFFTVELNAMLSKGSLEKSSIYNIKNLIEIRNHLHSFNTWPFEMNKVIGLMTVVVIPMASVVIDRLLKG